MTRLKNRHGYRLSILKHDVYGGPFWDGYRKPKTWSDKQCLRVSVRTSQCERWTSFLCFAIIRESRRSHGSPNDIYISFVQRPKSRTVAVSPIWHSQERTRWEGFSLSWKKISISHESKKDSTLWCVFYHMPQWYTHSSALGAPTLSSTYKRSVECKCLIVRRTVCNNSADSSCSKASTSLLTYILWR